MNTFRNPVVPGFNPDPSVCRVGDDYYLATSTFEYLPGVPILHSRDLVSWTTIGHALADLPDLRDVASSQGIFAPVLRHIGGRFVMITTPMPNGTSFYVTADEPGGPWSDPVWVAEDGWTMDPSLFEDSDGTVYYTRHGDGRHGGVYQAVIDLATGELDAPARKVWDGTGGIWPEGPHLYRIGDWYYLLISEGGTSYEHSLTVARSTSPWGPFEACPRNPILTHSGRRELPIQAVGHADLVDTPDGHWWAVLLGVRPIDGLLHLGRETFLAPVTWDEEGWPVVCGGQPLMLDTDATGLPGRDEAPAPFDAVAHDLDVDFTSIDRLGPEWIWLRGPLGERCRLDGDGLALVGDDADMTTIGTPTFVGVRQPGAVVSVRTELSAEVAAGDAAGLVVRLDERHHHELVVELRDGARIAVLHIVDGDDRSDVGAVPVGDGPVELRIEATTDGYEYLVDAGDGPVVVGAAPVRTVAIDGAEHFTGVVIGLHCRTGSTDRPCTAHVGRFALRC